jgi:hypothetical protein
MRERQVLSTPLLYSAPTYPILVYLTRIGWLSYLLVAGCPYEQL